VDLALSRVSLAALKARDRVRPDDADRASAAELREVLRRDREALRDPQPLRADVVPKPEMRQGLERTLATLSRPTAAYLLGDLALVDRLLDLTGHLADEGHLTQAMAEELLGILNRIEHSREEKRSQPDLGALPRLQRSS